MPSYSHLNRNRMKTKYTHFTENEITGSTHYDKKTDWGFVAVIAGLVFIALLIIGEQTGLTSLIFGTV